MKVKKVLCLLLILSLVIGALAACGGGSGGGTTTTTPSTTTNNAGTAAATPTGGEREHYAFSYYANYDWYGVREWGADLTSAFWRDKFNITANFSRPDGSAEELLNLRITSNDLPDAIWMDRGAVNIRMARMGLFVDLDTLKPMLPNNWYDDNILPATQEHLKIDGVLYGIPNWARKDASGGNVAWMVTTDIYNAAGAPTIMTYEDLYAYAINVRDNVPTTAEGLSVIPVIAEDGGWMPGSDIVRAIYRSLGAPFLGAGNMWSRVGSTYQFLYRDPLYREAILETNKWFNEGLLLPTHFTDSREQFLEKLTTARGGLIWYDHSQDDGNNFRRTVRTNYPGNSIELVTMDVGGRTYLYPPARGLSHDKIYGEHYGTVGWNVTCITTAARHPERIFELVSYWLTKEGSIEMMYGPQGGFFWSELNSDGNPILHVNPDDHPEEVDRYALWHYTLAGHADNVDHTKFAANDMLPADNRSWVVSAQAHIFTPLMRPLTDEFHAIGEAIEPDTPLHVQRTIVEDHVRATLAQIVMASSADAAERMIDEAIAFVDANGGLDIERVYNERYQENLAKQGGTIFNR